MKEKEIELSSEEIRYLLKGTIHWQDIEEQAKPWQRSSAGVRMLGETRSRESEKTREIEINRAQGQERNERLELNQVLLGDRKEVSTHGMDGRAVVFLLATVGVATLTIWAYFVFAS